LLFLGVTIMVCSSDGSSAVPLVGGRELWCPSTLSLVEGRLSLVDGREVSVVPLVVVPLLGSRGMLLLSTLRLVEGLLVW
jgi:hypothetical protein